MRTKVFLISICFLLGFLVTAPVSIARDPWALSGSQKQGNCNLGEGGDQCDFGAYPTRNKGNARRIGGFYIDPLNYRPSDARLSVNYQLRYCNTTNWTPTYSNILAAQGSNWMSFSGEVCEFRYSLTKAWGERLNLNFEMNYYLDY